MSDEQNSPQEAAAPQPAATMIKKIKVPVAPRPVQTPKPQPAAAPAQPQAAAPVQTAAQAAPVQAAAQTAAAQPQQPPAGDVQDNHPIAAGRQAGAKTPASPLPPGVSRPRRGAAVKPQQPPKQESEAVKAFKEKTRSAAKRLLHSKMFILSFACFLLCAAAAAGIASLPYLIESGLPQYLKKDGIALKSFKVKSLGFSQAELVNFITASGSVRVKSVKITYFPLDLWRHKQIKTMDVSGLTINGDISEDGISFGGLEGLLSAKTTRNPFSVKKLRLTNGQLIINSQNSEEPFVLGFTTDGAVQDSAMNLKTNVSFLNDNFSVKANVVLNKTKLQTDVTAEITEGNVLEGENVAGSVTGTWALTMESGALTQAKADLSMEMKSQMMKLAGTVTPHEDSSFSLDTSFSRKFKQGFDAGDNFTGEISLKSDKIVFTGNAQNATVDLPLDLKVVFATNKSLAIKDMTLALNGVLTCLDGACEYRLKKEAPIELNALQYTGDFNKVNIAEPVKFSLFTKDKLVDFQKGNLTFASDVLPTAFKAFVVTDDSSSQLAAALKNNAHLQIAYNVFTGEYAGKAAFSGAEVLTKDFKSPDVSGLIGFRQSSLTEAKFVAGSIVLTTPDIVAPFDLQATVAPLNADEYSLDMTGAVHNGLVTLKAKGSYNFAAKSWSLFLDMPKTAFSDTGIVFAETFPTLAKKLDGQMTGTLGMNGRLNVSGDKVTGAMKVLLMNVSTKIGSFDLKKLTGVLTVTSLNPFETAESQNVFIGQMNMGIPFKNVALAFRAQANGITLSALNMQYADASFRLVKPLFIPYDGVPNPFMIEGQGVSFSKLSSLMRMPGLEVDGTGELTMKMSLDKGDVMIEEGRLRLSKSSSGVGGMFRYEPPSSVKVKLDPRMKEFLKSVVFKDLTLTMNGKPTGKMKYNFKLDGYASGDETQRNRKINLDIDGPMQKILQPDGETTEMPLGIMNSIQENFK